MELTLVAPHAGTVTAIRTDVGAKVNPGEVLVEIAEA
jgi:biotin carboxyl carrier protein